MHTSHVTHTSDRSGFLFVLVPTFLGLLFGFSWMTPPPPSEDSTRAYILDDGEEVYMTRCLSCHQQDGTGIAGVFPPLDGTDWVVGDKGRLIRILLHGMQGETEVKGIIYSGAMPPWKSFLDDEQVAAVLTYIRGAWSNEAGAVTSKEVELVREATNDRSDAWTADELEQEANQGIPGAPSFNFLSPVADTTEGLNPDF